MADEPNEVPPAEAVPEVKPQWSVDNLPKNKTEWNTLQGQDPTLFGNLTQHNYDKLFRESKESQEKTTTLESQVSNLTVELDKYRSQQPSDIPVETPPSTTDTPTTYSINNLPKSRQAWDDLMIEDPVLGTDLRSHYTNKVTQNETNFTEAQATSRKAVQVEHPDMYLSELDESGQPKKDEQGKSVLKVDPASGEPIFNPKSDKGKIWLNIYESNPNIASNPQAPELLMASMERRLRVKGEKMVEESEAERKQTVQDGQVVAEGVPPPPQVKVAFANDEERDHAQNMVNRGLYGTLEEYVRNRDSKDEGIYDENRTPDFTKK